MVDDDSRPWVERVIGDVVVHKHHDVLLLQSSLLQNLVGVAHIGLSCIKNTTTLSKHP
jgi:hypothetical protein